MLEKLLEKIKSSLRIWMHINFLKVNGGVDPCAALRARVARLEGVLRFILDECDWEESMQHVCGDNRIGAAARRALEEK